MGRSINQNFNEKRLIYDAYSDSGFTNAEIAAIDSDVTTHIINPFAYTSTISDHNDGRIFCFKPSTVTLASQKCVSFGLFLTPSLELFKSGGLSFWCYGAYTLFTEDTAASLNNIGVSFWFGKADATTVTSTVATTANATTYWHELHSRRNTTSSIAQGSCSEQVTARGSISATNDKPWVFGISLRNFHLDSQSIQGYISMNFVKYDTTSEMSYSTI